MGPYFSSISFCSFTSLFPQICEENIACNCDLMCCWHCSLASPQTKTYLKPASYSILTCNFHPTHEVKIELSLLLSKAKFVFMFIIRTRFRGFFSLALFKTLISWNQTKTFNFHIFQNRSQDYLFGLFDLNWRVISWTKERAEHLFTSMLWLYY